MRIFRDRHLYALDRATPILWIFCRSGLLRGSNDFGSAKLDTSESGGYSVFGGRDELERERTRRHRSE